MSASFSVEYEDIEADPAVHHYTLYRDYELPEALADFMNAVRVSEEATLSWSS